MIVVAAPAVLLPTLAHLRHSVVELLLLVGREHSADLAHLLHHQRAKCSAARAVAWRAHAHGVGLQLVAIANESDLVALILAEVQPLEHVITTRTAVVTHPRALVIALRAR